MSAGGVEDSSGDIAFGLAEDDQLMGFVETLVHHICWYTW